MVFCEFLALCWESYGTGILAKPINERYTKPRLYILSPALKTKTMAAESRFTS